MRTATIRCNSECFVLLSADALTVPAKRIEGMRALATYVGGHARRAGIVRRWRVGLDHYEGLAARANATDVSLECDGKPCASVPVARQIRTDLSAPIFWTVTVAEAALGVGFGAGSLGSFAL